MKTMLLAIIATFFVFVGAQQNGDLRLVGGQRTDTGRVEIYLDGTWGTIDAGTTSSDQRGPAQTVCRQLGYDSSSRYGTVSDLGIDPAEGSVPMAIESVSCQYNSIAGWANQHILRCGYVDGKSNPDHQRDFAVQCNPSDISVIPYDTQVRLTQGNTGFSSSGFVEVYLHGSWGPVCEMGTYDADSACRQLGYTEAIKYSDSPLYDQGGKSDQVDEFLCYSSRACLRDCYVYADTYYAVCFGSHSYINCTFTESNKGLYGSGDEGSCTYKSIVALAVGVFFAILVFIVVLSIACCVVCCCIPGCIFHGSRAKVVYDTI